MLRVEEIKAIIGDFLDERILPAAGNSSNLLKWAIAGSSVLALNRFDLLFNKNQGILKDLGILDESNSLVPENIKLFLDTAFSKQSTIEISLLGTAFTLDKSDGDALLAIINRYREANNGQ